MSEIEHRFFQKINAASGTPSFCRRGTAVEDAWQALVGKCREKHREIAAMARLRLATFLALSAGQRHLAAQCCDESDLNYLDLLHRQWSYQLQIPVAPATSVRQLQTPFAELQQSFRRFNDRWNGFINKVDLSLNNRLRDNYNLYYLIEKECALWSSQIARRGFEPMPPLTHADLFVEFPLLRIPGIAPGQLRAVS